MNPLPEQFSSAGKTQLLAQLDFFGTLAAAAIDNTRRLADMQLQAGRASIEQGASTVRQLIDARAPTDLFRLAPVARGNLETMFAFGREMFSIASGAALRAQGGGAQPAEPAPASDAQPSRPQQPQAHGTTQAGARSSSGSAPEAPARTTLSDAMMPDPQQATHGEAARADAKAAFGSKAPEAAPHDEDLLDDNRALPVVEEVPAPQAARTPIAQAAADVAAPAAPTIAAAGMAEESEPANGGKSGRKLGKKN